jgi:hypothetical protein
MKHTVIDLNIIKEARRRGANEGAISHFIRRLLDSPYVKRVHIVKPHGKDQHNPMGCVAEFYQGKKRTSIHVLKDHANNTTTTSVMTLDLSVTPAKETLELQFCE